MTTSVGICVLHRFFSEENVKSWRSVFFVILTTMSSTFLHPQYKKQLPRTETFKFNILLNTLQAMRRNEASNIIIIGIRYKTKQVEASE